MKNRKLRQEQQTARGSQHTRACKATIELEKELKNRWRGGKLWEQVYVELLGEKLARSNQRKQAKNEKAEGKETERLEQGNGD